MVKNTYDINDTKLMHRNRCKIRHQVFIYEDMKERISDLKLFTISEYAFAIAVMAIEKMDNIRLPYIKDCDRQLMSDVRKVLI